VILFSFFPFTMYRLNTLVYQWHDMMCQQPFYSLCVCVSGCMCVCGYWCSQACGSIVTIFMYYLAPFPQIVDHFAWQYLVWWSLWRLDISFTLAKFFSTVPQFSSDTSSVLRAVFLQHTMQIVFSLINRPLPSESVISCYHHLTLQLFF